MWLLHNKSAIVVGLLVGVAMFLLYRGDDVTAPLADVMTTQQYKSDISYHIENNILAISNTAQTTIWTITIPISYDPTTVKLLTGSISSPYEYTFEQSRNWKITLIIRGSLGVWTIVSIPTVWDSSNISISSPTLISDTNTNTSLTIKRIE